MLGVVRARLGRRWWSRRVLAVALLGALAVVTGSSVALAEAPTQPASSLSSPTASSAASVIPTPSATPTPSVVQTPSETPAPSTSPEETPAATETSAPAAAKAHAAPRALAAAGKSLTCLPGVVYGISTPGQLQQVTVGLGVTRIGTEASVNPGGPAIPGVRSTHFNGLGVGRGGTEVYAFARTASREDRQTIANIYRYDVDAATWINLRVRYETAANGFTGSLVTGAVDLNTGAYFFGGFAPNGTTFWMWKFDPATSAVTFLGTVNTAVGSAAPTNGDMAFDSKGNLFIVRGAGSSTTIFSVTSANVAAANGARIPSSGSVAVPTVDNVNGVAFDSLGTAYLSTASTVTAYTMPGWTKPRSVVTSGFSGSDLASCSSPATITVQKQVIGRSVSSDQFRLDLSQGATLLGSTATSGNSTGVQEATVGPLPVLRGTTLNFSEAGSAGANLATYSSRYECLVDGQPMGVAGAGSSANVTIPLTGEWVCPRLS